MARFNTAGELAITAGDFDLVEVSPAANHPCQLRYLKIGQLTELAEAAEEQLHFQILRMRTNVVSGSGGSSGTKMAAKNAGITAGAQYTVEVANGTLATADDDEVFEEFSWNLRAAPLEMWWDEESCLDAINGQLIVVRLVDAPADALDMTIAVQIEEV